MSIDGLPQGQRARVYRRLLELLRSDPILSSVIKTWSTNTGEPLQDKLHVRAPELELIPRIGPMAMDSPDSWTGMLELGVVITATGRDVTDALDLWEAVENAVYPPDRKLQFKVQHELRTCEFRCTTGLVQFAQPASFEDKVNDMVGCVGTMQVEIRRLLNP